MADLSVSVFFSVFGRNRFKVQTQDRRNQVSNSQTIVSVLSIQNLLYFTFAVSAVHFFGHPPLMIANGTQSVQNTQVRVSVPDRKSECSGSAEAKHQVLSGISEVARNVAPVKIGKLLQRVAD